MKRIQYIILHVIAVFSLLTSCDLERNPLDKYAENAFWTDEENAQLALTGLYRGSISFNAAEYSPGDWWSYGGLLFFEFPTDNAYDRRGSSSNFHKMTDGTLMPNNAFIKNYWSNSYSKITRCNYFLEGIDNLNSAPEIVARFKAEARFLRATQYFYLSQFFGDVPLVTKVLTRDEANIVEKTSQRDILSFITQEFKEAAADLPRFKDLKSDEAGRASKLAALAFLGRTFLAAKEYPEAAKAYEEIISYGDNKIDPDYQSIFLQSNERSSENIFSMQYLQDMAGSALPQHAFSRTEGGWCLINITADLFEAYPFKDGTPFSYDNPLYNPDNLGENRDPRLDYTILYNGAPFRGGIYNCHPDSELGSDRIGSGQTTQTGFLMRKYMDETYTGNVLSYGGDLPIIRYAEVLLSYLEAKLEAGEAISQSLLDATINQIRGRASVNMPPVTETNPDRLRPILRNERRIELAMEGIRYWDLLRWGIAHEVLKGDIYGAPFPGSIRTSPNKNGEVDKYGRWYVNTRAFRNNQDYRWPIPQSEQDINPNLR